jgi:phosphonate transport system substrate-binding protein
MRFSLRGPMGWALAAGLVFAACGGTGTTTASTAPSAGATTAPSTGPRVGSFDRPVVLAFTPSQEASTIATNGNAVKSALEKATGLAWKVTAMSSYAAQVEAMGAGSVDVGFFAPLQMTLLIGKGYGTPILGALRKDDTGQLATTYKSQILVRTDSGINSLADLKGKTFAFVDPLSASGYVYPVLTVKNKTGQAPNTFFSKTTFAGSHPNAAIAVYNKQVDGAAMFIDARDSLVAANPDIKTATKVIDTAGPIPNDGVALRKGFPDDVGKTVKQALLDYSKDPAGAKVLSALFAWDGMQEITASFYDSIKEAAALAGVDVEGLAKNTPRPAATPAPTKTP